MNTLKNRNIRHFFVLFFVGFLALSISSKSFAHETDTLGSLSKKDMIEKKESKSNSESTCSLIEVVVTPGDLFPCDPQPSGSCDSCPTCRLIGLELNCPDCCVDSIVFHSGHGNCFGGCGVLQDPTKATWVSDPIGRMTECSHQDLWLKPKTTPSTWCHTKTLAFRLCTDVPAKIGYAAYLNCSPTPIQGYVFTY